MIPKDKSLWIFGSYGDQYNDNSKHFFEYVRRNKAHINAVWLTNNDELIKELRDKAVRVENKFSWRGFYTSARAGIVIISSYRNNVNPYAIGGSFVVNLWHGFSVKKMEYDIPPGYNKGFYWRRRIFEKFALLLPRFRYDYNLLTTPSKMVAKIYERTFRMKAENIVVTGDPRTDVLFPIRSPVDSPKTILYMPTFRSHQELNFFNYSFYPDRWVATLKKHDCVLKVRFHSNEKINEKLISTWVKTYDQFEYIQRKEDTYSLFTEASLLITDYSSVMFDFSITGRPVVFLPLDIEDYLDRERPMYFDYKKEIARDYRFDDWEQLREYIDLNGVAKIDTSRFLGQVHDFHDGKSSERVYNAIVTRVS